MNKWIVAGILVLVTGVLAGCVSKSDYETVVDEKTALTAQVSELTSQLGTLQEQYDEIASVFPPRDFSTVAELEAWLAQDSTDTLAPASTIEEQYSLGLKMQLAALTDGYIISIDQEYINEYFFFILAIAVVDGDTWVWEIDTDEIYQPIGWGKVTRE